MPKLKRDLTVEEQLARGPLDLPFLMLVVMLTAIGVIMVFSASYATAINEGLSPMYYFFRQGFFAAIGLAVMYAVSKINYQAFRWMSVFALALAFLLLILVLVPGIGVTKKGARRWIRAIGPIPQFQPSEFVKLAIILYFSARMSKRGTEKKRRYDTRKVSGTLLQVADNIGLIELIPYGLILLAIIILMALERHLSGTILILVPAAAILFAGGIKLGWVAAGGTAVGGLLLLMMMNTGYQTDRIKIWRDPWADPRHGGFQIIQSLYAIGSGGLFGVGFGQSRQKQLFLPEAENDFIFSIACEELGLVGAGLILLLFALLIIRGYWIAIHARDRFGTLLVVGVTTLMAVQVFLNIGVVTNLIPTTGISLPFFSYGGTALVIQLAEMGVVLGVSRQVQVSKQG